MAASSELQRDIINSSAFNENILSMTSCNLCPRNCRVNRTKGLTGFCGMGHTITAARAALHYWEEPVLSGSKGSGAVFFSGCNMRCSFCQNHSISTMKEGVEITVTRLSEIFLELQEKGAHNINLVTPTHYIPQLRQALEQAKKNGLHLPIVYNTSGYEKVEALKTLEGYIDIYLPDLKYYSCQLSTDLSKAPDYFQVATAAIAEMYRQVGEPVLNEQGLMERGVIVRHLLLPGQSKDSKKVLRYLYEQYHNKLWISIMNQYTPLPQLQEFIKRFPQYEALGRQISPEEYDKMLTFALRLGITDGFMQEGETAKESFIPAFNREGL